jgi:hypothetical protein
VALTNYDFLQVGMPGASLWLGGIGVDDYDGDVVRAAAATGRGVRTLPPVYGFPQNGKVGDDGFRFYPDRTMIAGASRAWRPGSSRLHRDLRCWRWPWMRSARVVQGPAGQPDRGRIRQHGEAPGRGIGFWSICCPAWSLALIDHRTPADPA